MDNLSELIREYKKTLNKLLMEKIYILLTPLIKKKSEFIFKKKYYPYSLYHKCVECLKCKNKINCDKCKRCSCIKGTFNLKKSGLCELEDIESDLWLEILRIIEYYDITKDFDTYMYSCIWEWKPSFLTKNFIKSLQNKSLSKYNQDEEDMDIPIENTDIENNYNIDRILKSCNSDNERTIIKMLINGYNQSEIAKKLKLTSQNVSSLILNLKDKIKDIINSEE